MQVSVSFKFWGVSIKMLHSCHVSVRPFPAEKVILHFTIAAQETPAAVLGTLSGNLGRRPTKTFHPKTHTHPNRERRRKRDGSSALLRLINHWHSSVEMCVFADLSALFNRLNHLMFLLFFAIHAKNKLLLKLNYVKTNKCTLKC